MYYARWSLTTQSVVWFEARRSPHVLPFCSPWLVLAQKILNAKKGTGSLLTFLLLLRCYCLHAFIVAEIVNYDRSVDEEATVLVAVLVTVI